MAAAYPRSRSGDHFTMGPHEFLSQMLGAHRPTVSLPAGMLQKAGYIRYSRGKVEVIDRQGLEEASCACYRVITDQYRPLARARLTDRPQLHGISFTLKLSALSHRTSCTTSGLPVEASHDGPEQHLGQIAGLQQ